MVQTREAVVNDVCPAQYDAAETPAEADEQVYMVWGSTQLVRDADGLVCDHRDTIDFDPEGPTNVRPRSELQRFSAELGSLFLRSQAGCLVCVGSGS